MVPHDIPEDDVDLKKIENAIEEPGNGPPPAAGTQLNLQTPLPCHRGVPKRACPAKVFKSLPSVEGQDFSLLFSSSLVDHFRRAERGPTSSWTWTETGDFFLIAITRTGTWTTEAADEPNKETACGSSFNKGAGSMVPTFGNVPVSPLLRREVPG